MSSVEKKGKVFLYGVDDLFLETLKEIHAKAKKIGEQQVNNDNRIAKSSKTVFEKSRQK